MGCLIGCHADSPGLVNARMSNSPAAAPPAPRSQIVYNLAIIALGMVGLGLAGDLMRLVTSYFPARW